MRISSAAPGLVPPDSAAEKQFAAALRQAADALKGASPAASPKLLERRMQPRMQNSPAPAKLDHAIAQLKALGY